VSDERLLIHKVKSENKIMTYDIEDDYASAEIFNDLFNLFVYEIEECVNKSKNEYKNFYNELYESYSRPVYDIDISDLDKQCNKTIARILYHNIQNTIYSIVDDNIDSLNKTMFPFVLDSVDKFFSKKYDRKYFERQSTKSFSNSRSYRKTYTDNPLFSSIEQMKQDYFNTESPYHYTEKSWRLQIYKNDNHLENVDDDIVAYRMLTDQDYQRELDIENERQQYEDDDRHLNETNIA